MQAKLLHDSFGSEENLPEAERGKYPDPNHVPLQAGTVIDHPDAWLLVRNGHAEPADDECRQAALNGDGRRFKPMSEAQLKYAGVRYKKLAVGQMTGDRRFDAPKGAFAAPKTTPSPAKQAASETAPAKEAAASAAEPPAKS